MLLSPPTPVHPPLTTSDTAFYSPPPPYNYYLPVHCQCFPVSLPLHDLPLPLLCLSRPHLYCIQPSRPSGILLILHVAIQYGWERGGGLMGCSSRGKKQQHGEGMSSSGRSRGECMEAMAVEMEHTNNRGGAGLVSKDSCD